MFQPNSVIAGRYQVIRLVGQGGMSNLYLAYDRKYANATVVIKEMTASYSDPKEQQMAVDLFHREAKLLASLNHRHIPKVFDYFQFAGKYYLSMEFIDGTDLAIKLEETKGPLPEKQVLEWGEQIATVLFYLHMHDPPIVFRDVKPSNIMINDQGVKLIDFGIARHFDQAKKGDTMRIGSPGYAPPEQYAAQTDPRSDIYALGVTLHHALTGRDPTATSTPFLVPPARSLNPNLSEATAAMLARATQIDPSDRYQSALELKKDIKHILQRNGQSTRVVGAPPSIPLSADATSQNNAGTAQTGAVAVQVAAPASAVAPGQAAPNQSPSGSLLAAASPSGTLKPPGSPSGTLTSQAGASQKLPKKSKKFSLGKLLLAACVFLAAAGITAFALMDSGARDALVDSAKARIQMFAAQLNHKQDPADKLRESLMAGKPEALLPLFQSTDFKELSEEKQELFRLNLLAAGSAEGKLKVIHLLLPEGEDQRELWKLASSALHAVNGSGGIGGEFLAIVPQTYQPGGLAALLNESSQLSEESPSQSYLVLGGEKEALPEKIPTGVVILRRGEASNGSFLEPLSEGQIDYDDLYGLQLSSDEAFVWGITGPTPQGALESRISAEKLPEAAALSEMLSQAQEADGRLILRAQDGAALSETAGKGEVLILSIAPEQLPKLSSELEGQALVLSSPFEPSPFGAVHLRPRPSDEPLDIPQARLFDAILLAAIGPGSAFNGLTLTRDSQGKYSKKSPTRYHWNENSWLPHLEEKGKKE